VVEEQDALAEGSPGFARPRTKATRPRPVVVDRWIGDACRVSSPTVEARISSSVSGEVASATRPGYPASGEGAPLAA